MKTILRTILLAAAILSLYPNEVKSQNFNWAKSFSSSANVTTYGIASDAAGNSYVTGYFEGRATFGTYQISSNGVYDIFVAKYDASGNCVWVKQAGGTSDDYGKGICVDAAGNIYVTGAFYGTASFGTVALTSFGEEGNPDIFTAKYDPNGNCIWARQAGGNNFDYGFGIATDAFGNSFITGYFTDTASFGGIQLISNGLKDIFIAKYDASGNCQWARQSGGTGDDIGYGIATDEDGNSYITGGFRNSLAFGTIRLVSYGGDDIFIAKYDPNGNCLWAKQAGDAYGDIGFSIAVDGNGNSYITGEFQETALFGTHSITSIGDYDIFTAKYDPSGECIWTKNLGGETEDRGRHISVDAIGDSYVTGQINTKGDNDIFITEYDPYGRNLWFQETGDTTNDAGTGISSQANGDCYVTGTFGGAANIGTTGLSGGGAFVTKISNHNLNITAPIGNETWMKGTAHTITWNSNDDGNIKIEMLQYFGGNWSTLVDSIKASTGSYTFIVPGNGYYGSSIRLTSLSHNTISECPNYFNTITTGELTDLRITSPNTALTCLFNTNQNITWVLTGSIANVKLEFSTDNGISWKIITNSTPAGTLSYIWNVPSISSTSCRIRITDAANPYVSDVSDEIFTISSAIQSSITIVSPKEGDIWDAGSTQTIRWTSNNVADLNIYYSLNGGKDWNIINTNIPAVWGSYTWKNLGIASTNCRIKLEDASDTTINSVSNTFTIITPESAYPTFNMTLANGVKADSIYEVDIYMLSTDTAKIEIASITLGFTIDNSPLNGGTLTASWVPGSNELTNTTQIPTTFNTSAVSNGLRVIKIAGKIPPGSGNGSMISNISPGTRIGRLRLGNSTLFTDQSLNIAWEFTLYPTSINAYVNTTNTNITSKGNFSTKLTQSLLPVELSSFVTKALGRNIVLNWETKTEVNFNKFEIERCLVNCNNTSLNWIQIGTVPASGNSNSSKKYFFNEKDLQSGKYQYRLKMIDNDGVFKYSDISISEIAIPKDFVLNQNFPNPFNPATRIEYRVPADSKIILEVYDITGKKIAELVNQDQPAGYYSVDFESSFVKLSSGVYIYRILAVDKATGKNFTAVRKMLLMK
jgi:hypothetical protein